MRRVSSRPHLPPLLNVPGTSLSIVLDNYSCYMFFVIRCYLAPVTPIELPTLYLIQPKEYSVGRKGARLYSCILTNLLIDCDIVVNEASVSRSHARLTLTAEDSLFIRDSSKYGSFVNEKQVTSKSNVQLREGDVIQLGVHGFRMHVKHVPLVFCFTLLTPSKKAELAAKLKEIGTYFISLLLFDRPATLYSHCDPLQETFA